MNEPMEAPESPAVESAESSESPAVAGVSGVERSADETAASVPESELEAPAPQSGSQIPRSRNAEDWMSGIQWLSSTVVLAVFVITFLAQAFQIPSQSMQKTLRSGDYLLVAKCHYA